jgi:site-specific DNA-methyltransferase (adenine-specific)/modification methylase
MTPYYQDAKNGVTLYLGDALEILPTLEAGSVDAVVTDPPYGTERDEIHNNARWNNSGGKKAWESKKWSAIVGDNTPFDPVQLLRFKRLCLWGSNWYADKLPHRRGLLIWDKTGCGKARAEFKNDCEVAWTTETDAVRIFHHMWNGYKRDSEIGEHVHPTQKPILLMEWCLSFFPDSQAILDPYTGSGTTGVACIRTGRRFIGIEIEEKYCAIAANRLRREAERFPLFEPVTLKQRELLT